MSLPDGTGATDAAWPADASTAPQVSGRRAEATASGSRSTSPPVVRPATPEDAAVLLELRAVMFEGMDTPPADVADPEWRRAALAWFAERVRAAGVRVVVVEVDGEVVSGAVGEVTALIPGPTTVNGAVGLISNVATRPGWRGRGFAAACTDELLRWFVEDTDVTRVDLFATAAGTRIYAPRGFRQRDFSAMCLPVQRPGTGGSDSTPPE